MAEEDIVHVMLDATVIKTRLAKKVTTISMLVPIGLRRKGSRPVLHCSTCGGAPAPIG